MLRLSKGRWKRAALLGFAVVATAAFAVSCGDDDDDDGGTGDGGSGEAGGEVTLRYLEHASFDPHFSSFAQDIGVQGMVFRGLYRLDKENKVNALMADDMPEVSDDGLTYTIKIQDDLEWSDGEPLKAKDFVAAFVRTCSPDNAGEYQYILFERRGV